MHILPLDPFFDMLPKLGIINIIKYYQTCVQRTPSGPKNNARSCRGRYSEVIYVVKGELGTTIRDRCRQVVVRSSLTTHSSTLLPPFCCIRFFKYR